MSDGTFTRLYQNLNPKQREAVDAIQGPVMVIAGPGTGKTSILTLRIANILRKTDTSPDSILALTFTESGAYSMRRKLVEIIGGAAYRVGIFTFHGFANLLIEKFSESFPRIVGGRPATEADQARILETIFIRNRFRIIRPFGDIFYYLPKALRAIKDLKRENISPAQFQSILQQEERFAKRAPDRFHTRGRFRGELKASHREILRRLQKSKELAAVYAQYEKELARERLFDFEDMILEAIRALENDRELLLSLQEQYQYILADEHQDANNAQNRILELLCSFDDQPNLFIVGDEKQAIYRFQGASLENFLYFKRLYPRAKQIALLHNYRSTQNILDASHSLMRSGLASDTLPPSVLRPRLLAKQAGEQRNVRFLEFSRPDTEVAFVISDIEERLKRGAAPRPPAAPARAGEIAVLVRDNRDALPFVEALEKTKIPFSVLSDEDILQDGELGKLLIILRAVAEPGNPARFAEMLHLDFLGVAPVALYELLQFCRARRVSLFEVLSNRAMQRKAKIGKEDALFRVYADFVQWARYARNSGAGEAVAHIARESGFVRHLLSTRGSLRSLEKMDSLFAALKDLSAHKRTFRLFDFLETLARVQKHGLRLSGKSARPEFLDSITVMTAHRAKGLEFDVVYIVNAVDGHWGGRRARSEFLIPPFLKGDTESSRRGISKSLSLQPLRTGAVHLSHSKTNAQGLAKLQVFASHPLQKGELKKDDEDERRLFYVALTRARKEAIITMSRIGEGGRARLPSPFVEDIAPAFLLHEDSAEIEKQIAKQTPFYFKPKINFGPSITLREYLRKVFLEQGLTVTALNNYLSCPWSYFFKNLVRLPALPESYLSYGTAMHEALHRFFNRFRAEQRGKAELLRLFDRALAKSPLPRREFEDYTRRGRAALSGYFNARKRDFVRDTRNEFEITGVFLPFLKGVPPSAAGRDFFPPDLLLRGKLDKIERNPDGTVTVVDYKTGRPKSRAEILGETKSSKGNMKRQLNFYKLLLDNREKDKYRMVSGVIDFVEPDANGIYHREVFEITNADVSALTAEIQRVGKEIYNFEFWDKTCGDRKCEYCKLRESIT